ncbi:MAG TPA: prephenate dehydrogenase/arogenate dehydrogenase family protein [Candidatus Hydrogenedentes bacterium]|nr:prephenate dehydrogenase/arogenate dehydrogenase family protein [Candidatus Hydrogenedentota bacterium]
MKRRYRAVTIIGVGLLGGSLGLALKARGLAGVVRGVGRRRVSLETALAVGAVDEVSLDAVEASRGAALVVVCTPAAQVSGVLDAILPVCLPDAAVTDVASTKALICAHARASWPRPLRFVGSHPMAGSDKFGPEHARADFYEDSVAIVTPDPAAAPDAVAAVRELWESVGAHVAEVDAGRHDAFLARTSHVPHVAAACLARLVNACDNLRPFIGQGYRDMTRIAASRPEIWRDTCLTNRDAILDGIDALSAMLDDVRDAVGAADAERIETFFRDGQRARKEAVGE